MFLWENPWPTPIHSSNIATLFFIEQCLNTQNSLSSRNHSKFAKKAFVPSNHDFCTFFPFFVFCSVFLCVKKRIECIHDVYRLHYALCRLNLLHFARVINILIATITAIEPFLIHFIFYYTYYFPHQISKKESELGQECYLAKGKSHTIGIFSCFYFGCYAFSQIKKATGQRRGKGANWQHQNHWLTRTW